MKHTSQGEELGNDIIGQGECTQRAKVGSYLVKSLSDANQPPSPRQVADKAPFGSLILITYVRNKLLIGNHGAISHDDFFQERLLVGIQNGVGHFALLYISYDDCINKSIQYQYEIQGLFAYLGIGEPKSWVISPKSISPRLGGSSKGAISACRIAFATRRSSWLP